MIPIRKHPQGLTFNVKVQPRSSKNEISGIHAQTLKVKLTAPPVDNAANKMCITFLAKCLDIPRSCIEILSGRKSRTKLILVKPKSVEITVTELNDLKKRIASLVNDG